MNLRTARFLTFILEAAQLFATIVLVFVVATCLRPHAPQWQRATVAVVGALLLRVQLRWSPW